MTRDELIRRLRRLANERGVPFDVKPERGKGGHWYVRYGDIEQPVPQAKGRDLRTSTLHAILRTFGLRRKDLE